MILEGRIQIPFRYAAGKAGSRFLTALQEEGTILASPCPACGQVYCPARSFCARCGAELEETIPVGPEGELLSWTEVQGKGAFCLVRLDGAHSALLHRLLAPPSWHASDGSGADGSGASGSASGRSGIRVRARFASQRTGSILDLAGFEPIEEDRP